MSAAAAWPITIGLVLVWSLTLLTGPVNAAGTAAAPSATPATHDATLDLGRKVYNFRCYFCHGYSGNAKTLAASYLRPAPRDFTQGPPLSANTIAQTLRTGRPGTAMKSFRGILGEDEIVAVAAFVERRFVQERAVNTRYHTAENGWPGHQRHAAAFPFVTGELKLDAPTASLDDNQRRGRALYLGACISCHDRGHVDDAGPAWSARPLSYPRMGFVPGQQTSPVDAVSSASVYAKHDVVPRIDGLAPHERDGERLFQANCAFCHGADGTGRNWIGQFMEPKARDLTQYTRRAMPATRLVQVIREGLPGTSMPAWRDVLSRRQSEAVAAYVARAFFRPDPGDRSPSR